MVTPGDRFAVIIGNSDYSELRHKESYGGFGDLNETNDDIGNFKNGI